MELSIVVPCYNEEENIHLLVSRIIQALDEIEALKGHYEIVLVNDGSKDQTGTVIESVAKQFPCIVPCHHSVNQGIVSGWRTGFKASKGRFVMTTDADLQYLPEDIPRLYQEAQNHSCDLVQGWRKEHREGGLRAILSVGLSLMLNFLFGMNLKDIKSGFILYRRECFEKILDYKGNYYFFQHFITVSGHAYGFSIRQVPIVFDRRNAGTSFIQSPFRFSLKALHDIPIALWEYRFKRNRLKKTEWV